jgi:hypothetical protein
MVELRQSGAFACHAGTDRRDRSLLGIVGISGTSLVKRVYFHQGENDHYFTSGLPELSYPRGTRPKRTPETGLKPQTVTYCMSFRGLKAGNEIGLQG